MSLFKWFNGRFAALVGLAGALNGLNGNLEDCANKVDIASQMIFLIPLWPLNCILSLQGLYKFLRGLLQRARRTGMERLKVVIFHLIQRHLSYILRCVAVCNI